MYNLNGAPNILNDPQLKPPLDARFYELVGDDLTFFKSQTRIEDEEALKRHILNVQAKAYEIHGYPCIRMLGFIKSNIWLVSAYEAVLKLGRSRQDAILLDIGCFFGVDVRKAVADGWPVRNIIASDLYKEFWDYGHDLFKSTSVTFPAAFVPGDIFDPAFIAPRPPFYEAPHNPPLALESLKSLTPLQGHVSVIHVSSFFHLFDEAKQLEACRQVASLLSPVPGSIIFGAQCGYSEKGWWYRSDEFPQLFCHSPESWTELWDGEVFKEGSVKVDIESRKLKVDPRSVDGLELLYLWWSVTRL